MSGKKISCLCTGLLCCAIAMASMQRAMADGKKTVPSTAAAKAERGRVEGQGNVHSTAAAQPGLVDVKGNIGTTDVAADRVRGNLTVDEKSHVAQVEKTANVWNYLNETFGSAAIDQAIQELGTSNVNAVFAFLNAANIDAVPHGPGGGEDCASATVIASLPFADVGTTVGALNDYDEVCPYTGSLSGDVAFSYTPAANESINIDLCASGYDTKTYVYEGACPGTLIACNDDFCPGFRSQLSSVPLTGGTTYYIIVDGYGSQNGAYTLNVTAAGGGGGGGGEDCASATVIASLPYTDSGTTVGAINDYDEVCPYTGSLSGDVAYSYTPAANEAIDIDLCLSGYDTKTYVYEGSCPGTLIACNDDSCPGFRSQLFNVALTGGSTYYIIVDGYGSLNGAYTLNVTSGGIEAGSCCEVQTVPGCDTPECQATVCAVDPFCCATAWDAFCVAEALELCGGLCPFVEPCGSCVADMDGNGRLNGSDVQAFADCVVGTIDGVEPPGCGCADVDGDVDIDVDDATAFAAALTDVFNKFCGDGEGRCCQDGGNICTPNLTLYECNALGGLFTAGINCDDPCPIIPEDCEDAILIAVPSSTIGDNTGATDDAFPPACNTPTPNQGVWYDLVGTGNTITLTTCNAATTFDSMIEIFCGECVNPICIGGNDDNCAAFGLRSTVSFCSTLGETYHIRMSGFGGSVGTFQLDVIDDGIPCFTALSCIPGACCRSNGACIETSEAACATAGGTFLGGTCAEANCPPSCVNCVDEEGEAANCGILTDTVNGGCNSTPNIYSPIACNQTVCGTAWADAAAGGRDTDWYELTLTTAAILNWSATADFPFQMAILDGACPPAILSAFLQSPACAPLAVTATVPPGTYHLFISPSLFDGSPCAAGPWSYSATVNCTEIPNAGACCINQVCTDEVSPDDCAAGGGFYAGLGSNCASFTCPGPNDECAGALPIACEETASGTIFGAVNNYNPAIPGPSCTGFDAGGPDVVYSFSVAVDSVVSLTYAPTGVLFDAAVYVVTDCFDMSTCVAGADDNFAPGTETLIFGATAGVTYYIICDQYPFPVLPAGAGPFDLSITCSEAIPGACCSQNGACTEVVSGFLCPDGNTFTEGVTCAEAGCVSCVNCTDDEGEAANCGILADTVNGGCNSTPFIYSPIACEQTVCGTAWADAAAGGRDTDWYELVLNTAAIVSWTATADFPFQMAILDAACPPAVLSTFGVSGACTPLGVSATLSAGTYHLFISPSAFDGSPCAAGPWTYSATVNCTPVGAGGACCNAGTCTDEPDQATCEGTGGSFQGLGTDCTGVECVANDTCASATVIASLPYSDSGSTLTATNDYDEVCPYTGSLSRDVAYTYTPAANETISIDLCSSGYDTKTYVYQDSCPGTLIACNDDSCGVCGGGAYCSQLLNVPVSAGTTYYIIVDGYFGANGTFNLNVTTP